MPRQGLAGLLGLAGLRSPPRNRQVNMLRMDTNQQAKPDHPTLSTGLLGGVQQMDPESWSRLVTTFGPIVYRWCRTAGVPDADAADVTQDIFASLARGIATFERQKEQGSFRSWLATITRNRVRDYFRLRARQEAAVGGTAALQQLQALRDAVDSTISNVGVASPLAKRVLEHVKAEFEPATWNAFWMTAVDGKTASDVSAVCGISVASVYQAKSRVLRRLRQRLAELPE